MTLCFSVLKNLDIQPRFIEAHRLAEFNPRGNDVPVILDLMIHDLDIILSLVKSEIKDIRANGVKVVSSTVDIANARLEFENGCVANLTASRISQKVMRKMRLFQEEDYITIDFHNGILEEYKICNSPPTEGTNDQVIELAGKEKKYVFYRKPEVPKHDALREELIHFANSIKNVQKPETDGESAAQALSIALKIQKIIDQ
jgi:predicted dehydrogenase